MAENNNNNNQFNWSSVATAGAGGVLGMIGNVLGNQNAYNQQQNLMNLQFQNQQALNQQAHDLGKDMWDYTNYENQAQHMRNAGLNIGLMYGGGGGGGSTTSQPSGGGAGGGSAPMPINVMEMMNQMQMTKANIELAQANAEKARAEASSIKGEEGTIGQATIRNLNSSSTATDIENAYRNDIKDYTIQNSDGTYKNVAMSGNTIRAFDSLIKQNATLVERNLNSMYLKNAPQQLKNETDRVKIEAGKLDVMYKMAQNDAERNEIQKQMNKVMENYYKNVTDNQKEAIDNQQDQFEQRFEREKWQYWTDKAQHNIDNTIGILVPWYTPPTTIEDSGSKTTTINYDKQGNVTGSSTTNNRGNTRTISRGR